MSGSSQRRDDDEREGRRPKEATKFHPSQARSSADFNASRPGYVLRGFDRPILKTRRKISFLTRVPASRAVGQVTVNLRPREGQHEAVFVRRSEGYSPEEAMRKPWERNLHRADKALDDKSALGVVFDKEDTTRKTDPKEKAIGKRSRQQPPPRLSRIHRVPLVNSGIQVVQNSRYLLKKTMLCMNFRLGCPYRLKLRHLQKHCDEQCKFTPVPCELCEEVIAKCHFQQHSQQCPRRDPAKDLQH
ncbi:hypothetical protein HPB52_020144 [Rhipicephalus sanguineus]|uniref:Uncharacterized protein n=1 Tax=Rhipicephalus sanguineus TaxID=34632 RepID=A0A9D4SXI9_RHISA|nr:hypothetical protein HPB52_020144 [Rhipicephalus sanguineus]